MQKPKLIRITTIPISLEKLLEGQLAFMKQYYQVTAISAEKEKLEAYGLMEGVGTFHIELTRKITPVKDLRAVYKMYRFLKSEKPEIVHTHTPKAGIVGMLAAYFAGVPHRLHTVAGLPLMEATGNKRRLLNFIEKLTYRCATGIYPNSQGLFDFILTENFTTPKKLSIIGKGSSNGIDTAYFSSSLYKQADLLKTRRDIGIPEEDFVFVFVGRIVKDKGINEMVTAFIQLLEKQPQCSLLLVGPFEADLDPVSKETEDEINRSNKIFTTGFQQDVRLYFALSNALVFPSYREGFPNVVLQAGAMGLPSIVSDINGCNEIVEHGFNGHIVPVKNADALLSSMLQFASNSQLITNLAKNSRTSITSRFERKQVWKALLENYQQL